MDNMFEGEMWRVVYVPGVSESENKQLLITKGKFENFLIQIEDIYLDKNENLQCGWKIIRTPEEWTKEKIADEMGDLTDIMRMIFKDFIEKCIEENE